MGGCVNKTETASDLEKTQGKITERMFLRTLSINSSFKNIDKSYDLCSKLLSIIAKKTNRTVSNIQPAFRASEHKFKASAFHEACNNKTNTVLLAYTTTNHIFGGFTPCAWSKDVYFNYSEDQSSQSFLFAIKGGEIKTFNLKEGSKGFAIMNDEQLGPVFGQGHDIHINDEADKKQSWNNLGKSYECIHKFGSVKANSSLCEEEKYKLKEYEIWEIKFQ